MAKVVDPKASEQQLRSFQMAVQDLLAIVAKDRKKLVSIDQPKPPPPAKR